MKECLVINNLLFLSLSRTYIAWCPRGYAPFLTVSAFISYVALSFSDTFHEQSIMLDISFRTILLEVFLFRFIESLSWLTVREYKVS